MPGGATAGQIFPTTRLFNGSWMGERGHPMTPNSTVTLALVLTVVLTTDIEWTQFVQRRSFSLGRLRGELTAQPSRGPDPLLTALWTIAHLE